MKKHLTIILLTSLSLTTQLYGAEQQYAEPYRTPSPEPQEVLDARRRAAEQRLAQQRRQAIELGRQEAEEHRQPVRGQQLRFDDEDVAAAHRHATRRRRQARMRRNRRRTTGPSNIGRRRIYGPEDPTN